jgi:hypothetical protein
MQKRDALSLATREPSTQQHAHLVQSQGGAVRWHHTDTFNEGRATEASLSATAIQVFKLPAPQSAAQARNGRRCTAPATTAHAEG